MKRTWHERQSLKLRNHRLHFLGLLVLTASSGCASMKSPTSWFSGGASKSAASLSSTGQGVGGQVKSMGSTVSSAMGKAKNFVMTPFGNSNDSSDPTSLSNMPTSLGPEIWITNGQLYETQGKQAKAMENYVKALEVEPNSEAALMSIGRLHARQQQYMEAEKYFTRALAVKPQADTFNEIAMLQQKQGRIAESQASLFKAIQLEPANVRYRNNLAGVLVSSGQSDAAVQQLQQVHSVAEANYNVAFLHFSNQNLPAAQQYLQLALQADPNLTRARDLLDKINGNPSTQSAMAAYQTANQIYRTAQAVTTPQQGATGGTAVPATSAIYQQTPSTPMPQSPYPQNMRGLPTTGYPAQPAF